MILIEDLWKTFGGQEVLRGISLEVKAGEFVALVGMSGSGKSVLLRHLVRLMRPDFGRVLVDGCDVEGMPREELLPGGQSAPRPGGIEGFKVHHL